jgi:hypothetical protein
MRRFACTLAILLSAASAASAQDGGKLTWPHRDNPKAAMTEGRGRNRVMMLYFTSVGAEPSKKFSAEALSDPDVVAAAERLTCVFVECNWGKANVELANFFKVKAYPTVILIDPEGKTLGTVTNQEPKAVAKLINDAVAAFTEKPGGAAEAPIQLRAFSITDAITAGRRRGIPAILFFRDDSPASTTVAAALTDPSMKEFQTKLTLGVETYTKGAGLTATFEVTRAPTVLIVDPTAPKPHEKILSRNEGSRSVRELIREFERVLERQPKERPDPAADPGTTPKTPPPPEEKLSDDQVERLFIQARVSVAQDLVKKGQKAKAIEIYEDLIKTYPKHVDIVNVRKLLEEAKK